MAQKFGIEFYECPFCGRDDYLEFEIGVNGKIACVSNFLESTYAEIRCTKCMLRMNTESKAEHYEQVDGDMYRKIPFKAAISVLADRWNKRVPATDEYEF